MHNAWDPGCPQLASGSSNDAPHYHAERSLWISSDNLLIPEQAGARNASEPQSSREQGDGFLNSFQSFHKHTPDSLTGTRQRLQNPAGPLMQDQIANAAFSKN